MDLDQLRQYCLSLKGSVESLPFGPDNVVFKVGNKIFAIMPLEGQGSINLKCDPDYAIELRERYPLEVLPGYHMNKKHWNTVKTDGNLNPKLIQDLISKSYTLIVASLSKKAQELLESGE